MTGFSVSRRTVTDVTSHLRLTFDERVAHIELNRPERGNALTSDMLWTLVAHCEQIAGASADVVVLSAVGEVFSVGFDLDEIAAGKTSDGAHAGAKAIESLLDLEAVTVAALGGWVVGGGAALAAACDLRVGDASVTVRIPEVPLGIPLGWGAMPLLVAEIGPAAAKELVMTGRDMGAEEAYRRGFLSRLAPADGLQTEVTRLVDELLSVPAGPLRTTKAQANAAAAVLRTGEADSEKLIAAVQSPEFRAVFNRYLNRVRPATER